MIARTLRRRGHASGLQAAAFSLFLSGACLPLSGTARADRLILSPLGDTLPINTVRAEFVTGAHKATGDMSWLAVSSGSGIELELQRLAASTEDKKRYSFNIEYPQVPFANFLAVSLGVRDVTGTGTEHGAFYIAAMSPIRFYGHKPLLRELCINGGVGTGRMDGLFVGMEARLAGDVRLSAEFYRQRPNVGIAFPLVRNLHARAYSLDGSIYYGLAYSWVH